MTNYEELFKEQMRDPQFAKAYYEYRLDRMVNDLFENLKERISNNEPKEELIKAIEEMQKQFD